MRRDLAREREFADLLSCTVQAQASGTDPRTIARNMGLLTRASISTSSDLADIGTELNNAFFASLEYGLGIFDVVARRARPAPMRTQTFIPTGSVVARVTSEGVEAQASSISLDANPMQAIKVSGLAVTTEEAVSTPEGSQALGLELREAVTVAVDTAFLSRLAGEAGHTGAITGDPLTDIATLINKVNLTGYADLILVVTPPLANTMSTMEVDGVLTFPDMSPTGGSACGIEVMVSAGSPGMVLIDAGAILAGSQAFSARTSAEATVNVGTIDSPEYKPLFQLDALGVIGTRTFAARTVRAAGVGVLFTEIETT
jgi:hypothetical protein